MVNFEAVQKWGHGRIWDPYVSKKGVQTVNQDLCFWYAYGSEMAAVAAVADTWLAAFSSLSPILHVPLHKPLIGSDSEISKWKEFHGAFLVACK